MSQVLDYSPDWPSVYDLYSDHFEQTIPSEFVSCEPLQWIHGSVVEDQHGTVKGLRSDFYSDDCSMCCGGTDMDRPLWLPLGGVKSSRGSDGSIHASALHGFLC